MRSTATSVPSTVHGNRLRDFRVMMRAQVNEEWWASFRQEQRGIAEAGGEGLAR